MLLVWWAKHADHPWWAFVIGMIINILGMAIWAYSMKKGEGSVVAGMFYALFMSAGSAYVGFVYFHETLSAVNVLGMVLAVMALLLISLG